MFYDNPQFDEMSRAHKKGDPIDVTCAIIEEDDQILVTQRGARMRMPFKWEFPGGKVEPSETAEECLVREIYEELGIKVQIKFRLPPSCHSYPDFDIRLHPFVCRIAYGRIVPAEHHAVRWTTLEQLRTYDWTDADVAVVQSYIDYVVENDGA